ncbi:hypothetical protein [uncultured Methylobacterium sp.]|uniref:hypothetical protein n=1 Tax=uncultured Methylobacterium sp. TaxID=157278 RepID=UPI0035CAF6F2
MRRRTVGQALAQPHKTETFKLSTIPPSSTCIVCADLQNLRLAEHRRTRRESMTTGLPGPPPPSSLPALRQAIIGRLLVRLMPPVRCPRCRRRFQAVPPTSTA